MKYFKLEPEVAGELGSDTILDNSVHPPVISKLEYKFIDWLGDDIVESFPCFIASKRLTRLLESSSLTGFILDNARITVSEEFSELNPGLELPEFFWLKITGTAGVDDFGVSDDYSLVVSENAMDILHMVNIENCGIEHST